MQEIPSALRRWIAAVVVVAIVLIVWRIIDWRMQPPPPKVPAVSLP